MDPPWIPRTLGWKLQSLRAGAQRMPLRRLWRWGWEDDWNMMGDHKK